MKDTIITVEGPQGAGKTTFTNYLREKMSATDLYILEVGKALILSYAEFIDFLVLRLVRKAFGCDEIVALLKLYEDAPEIARR